MNPDNSFPINKNNLFAISCSSFYSPIKNSILQFENSIANFNSIKDKIENNNNNNNNRDFSFKKIISSSHLISARGSLPMLNINEEKLNMNDKKDEQKEILFPIIKNSISKKSDKESKNHKNLNCKSSFLNEFPHDNKKNANKINLNSCDDSLVIDKPYFSPLRKNLINHLSIFTRNSQDFGKFRRQTIENKELNLNCVEYTKHSFSENNFESKVTSIVYNLSPERNQSDALKVKNSPSFFGNIFCNYNKNFISDKKLNKQNKKIKILKFDESTDFLNNNKNNHSNNYSKNKEITPTIKSCSLVDLNFQQNDKLDLYAKFKDTSFFPSIHICTKKEKRKINEKLKQQNSFLTNVGIKPKISIEIDDLNFKDLENLEDRNAIFNMTKPKAGFNFKPLFMKTLRNKSESNKASFSQKSRLTSKR
jgi:hypothetical protein